MIEHVTTFRLESIPSARSGDPRLNAMPGHSLRGVPVSLVPRTILGIHLSTGQ
jgi:hypothetical protein